MRPHLPHAPRAVAAALLLAAAATADAQGDTTRRDTARAPAAPPGALPSAQRTQSAPPPRLRVIKVAPSAPAALVETVTRKIYIPIFVPMAEPVPEPGTVVLLATGLGATALAVWRWRRARRPAPRG